MVGITSTKDDTRGDNRPFFAQLKAALSSIPSILSAQSATWIILVRMQCWFSEFWVGKAATSNIIYATRCAWVWVSEDGYASTSSRCQKGRKLLCAVTSKRLDFSSSHKNTPLADPWSEDNNKALIGFILFHGTGDKWSSHSRSSNFWSEAVAFFHKRFRATKKRSGMPRLTSSR